MYHYIKRVLFQTSDYRQCSRTNELINALKKQEANVLAFHVSLAELH